MHVVSDVENVGIDFECLQCQSYAFKGQFPAIFAVRWLQEHARDQTHLQSSQLCLFQ